MKLHRKHLITLVTFLTIGVFGAQAQASKTNTVNLASNSDSFRNAVGLRAGGTSGITYKRINNNSNAFEAILGMWHNGLSLTALKEKYSYAGTPGLWWYYGFGGHVAAETNSSFYNGAFDRYEPYRTDALGLGVDGIVGLEYKIRPIPFAVSLDLKPFVEVTTEGNAFVALDPALGVKLTF